MKPIQALDTKCWDLHSFHPPHLLTEGHSCHRLVSADAELKDVMAAMLLTLPWDSSVTTVLLEELL